MIYPQKHLSVFIFLLLILAAGVCSCTPGEKEKATGKTSSEESPRNASLAALLKEMNIYQFKELTPAPDFELESISGEMVSLRQQRGKVVMLSFWASW